MLCTKSTHFSKTQLKLLKNSFLNWESALFFMLIKSETNHKLYDTLHPDMFNFKSSSTIHSLVSNYLQMWIKPFGPESEPEACVVVVTHRGSWRSPPAQPHRETINLYCYVWQLNDASHFHDLPILQIYTHAFFVYCWEMSTSSIL